MKKSTWNSLFKMCTKSYFTTIFAFCSIVNKNKFCMIWFKWCLTFFLMAWFSIMNIWTMNIKMLKIRYTTPCSNALFSRIKTIFFQFIFYLVLQLNELDVNDSGLFEELHQQVSLFQYSCHLLLPMHLFKIYSKFCT